MTKTTQNAACPDVIGEALAVRRPRRPQRMARVATATVELLAATPSHEAQLVLHTPSKIAGVVALLMRDEGATLKELVETTGWLPHTTRAALTGLRKKGHVIVKAKRGEVTCYRIAAKA